MSYRIGKLLGHVLGIAMAAASGWVVIQSIPFIASHPPLLAIVFVAIILLMFLVIEREIEERNGGR